VQIDETLDLGERFRKSMGKSPLKLVRHMQCTNSSLFHA